MKKTGEVLGHPLWMMPVMILAMLAFIEGIHTVAHWQMETDVHGHCTSNKEYLEKLEYEDDY